MDKTILSIGLVVLVIGLFLAFAFWPIFGVSGSELADNKDGPQYDSYDEGDQIMVYGTITNIGEYPDWMEMIGMEERVHVEINEDFDLYVRGTDSIDYETGDDIFCRLTLQEEDILGQAYEYWEMEGDLNSKRLVDYTFYGITGGGVALVAVAALKD